MMTDQQTLTQCGHPDCRTWRSKPCGEGCYWQPPDSYERVRAAAPELLEALKVLVDEATGFGVSGVYFDEPCMGHKGPALAYAAIAKAEGNQP